MEPLGKGEMRGTGALVWGGKRNRKTTRETPKVRGSNRSRIRGRKRGEKKKKPRTSAHSLWRKTGSIGTRVKLRSEGRK